jgi:hypothetical protein
MRRLAELNITTLLGRAPLRGIRLSSSYGHLIVLIRLV